MDKRYIGCVVQTRSDTRKTISQVVKTKFFPSYRAALNWLREISDTELRDGKNQKFARYIRPVDMRQYYTQP